MGHGVDVIERIAQRKILFRERDVEAMNVSASCLDDAEVFRIAKPHGHGVWSSYWYEPTRYELVQIRLESAVFWGPSALWLLGATSTEPSELWIALSNNSHLPRTVPLDTVVIRTRSLERAVQIVRQPGTVTDLRVHSRARAEADVAQSDLPHLVSRALKSRRFELAPGGEFLFAGTQSGGWTPPAGPHNPEDWTIVKSIPRVLPPKRPRAVSPPRSFADRL